MKTIEELATEWSSQYIGKSRRDITCIAYEMGANDQRSIDIEKACELFRAEVEQANKIINFVSRGKKGGDLIDVDKSVETFRNKLSNNE